MIAQTSGSNRRNFYLLLLALILLVTVMDYQQGRSGADILRHVMLCPVYLLAGHGIAALFPPVDRASSSWWIDMERHILDGLSLAIFPVVVILDHPGVNLLEQLQTLLLFMLAYVSARCVMSWVKHRPSTR